MDKKGAKYKACMSVLGVKGKGLWHELDNGSWSKNMCKL